ncbi:Centromere protein I [Microtus ochrogaster]|uniref:Centromere protein I n=1 Tax=Microtus ochrogaster TaxID=79684 RepID=A0A8J6FYJ2_MICOH|nr:Centromere protein I [Microtus ochrogaster]
MATQRKTRSSELQNRISQGSNTFQTSLLAWKVKEKSGNSKSVLKESSSMEDPKHADDQDEDDLQIAVGYFQKGPKKTSLNKNTMLEKHLKTVENVAWKNGLAPEAIDILLNVALSGKFGNAISIRILKCMIPETLISEDSVVKAVSWLCVGKCSGNTKVLFYRWLVAMFDFIDHKKQINLLYGFFFASLQDDALIYFNNSKNLWTSALVAVKLRNQRTFPEPPKLTLGPTKGCSLKRKWSSLSVIPALNSANKDCGEKTWSLSDYFSSSRSFPLEELQSFSHLLQNIHCLELPSQMSSVLNNSLLLHYINCVKDESILLRLYYWLSQALQEECVWYNMNNYEQEKEFVNLLDIVIRVQCFLQCSLLQSLKELLQNWLLWLSMDAHVQPVTSSPL